MNIYIHLNKAYFEEEVSSVNEAWYSGIEIPYGANLDANSARFAGIGVFSNLYT